MRKFTKIIVSALIILFLVNTFVDFQISKKFQDSKSPLCLTWNDITKKSINANLVVIGNSRASWQYDTRIMDSLLRINSYVIGLDGRGINSAITKYDIYRHYQQTKPDNIIVNVDYFGTLVWSYGPYREQFFPYLFEPYFRRQIKKVEPFSLAELYLPVYRYTTYKGLWALIREDGRYVDESIWKGFTPNDLSWDGTEFEKIKSFHFSPNPKTMAMFDEFLTKTKEDNINVIFCFAPIYIGLTNKVDNLDDVYFTFQQYATKYDIPILDYTFSKVSMDTTFFHNATHLNKKGAELFTIMLCYDIDSLGICY